MERCRLLPAPAGPAVGRRGWRPHPRGGFQTFFPATFPAPAGQIIGHVLPFHSLFVRLLPPRLPQMHDRLRVLACDRRQFLPAGLGAGRQPVYRQHPVMRGDRNGAQPGFGCGAADLRALRGAVPRVCPGMCATAGALDLGRRLLPAGREGMPLRRAPGILKGGPAYTTCSASIVGFPSTMPLAMA